MKNGENGKMIIKKKLNDLFNKIPFISCKERWKQKHIRKLVHIQKRVYLL